jgi:3'(2'), 5'-bisphosphate nucleotidase|tara:strand:- start:159234 stop:160061 length:828 start_codon:yes stop_codon:yes gene_type:complete
VNHPFLKDVMALAVDAGKSILSFYRSGDPLPVMTKQDRSPVTEADYSAHRVLAAGLPDLLAVPVLSEESEPPSLDVRARWGHYWLVDPLDGTREFLDGNDEFTVNIALVESGMPTLGVIYVPVTGIGYAGGPGLGAFKYKNQQWSGIQVRTEARRRLLEEPFRLVASRRHGLSEVSRLAERLRYSLSDVVISGVGSSLKFCHVAEGYADLYPRFAPTSEWDTAAGQAILEAAGGCVVGLDFRPLVYNNKSDFLNPFFYGLGDRAFPWQELLTGLE